MASSSDNSTTESSKPNGSRSEVENLTEALRELAKGEQTATALESNLTKIEDKLDAILAALEATVAAKAADGGESSRDDGQSGQSKTE
ncbi:hypothetical protein PT974_08668 [Cladobotryum mycophilum]|uniref:EKC/KEOPS complex subunit GON7 n=1 Tax=Cladobotryum mycophilum TaxID=491253 RepID=A0ABR0SE30_9HYPO